MRTLTSIYIHHWRKWEPFDWTSKKYAKVLLFRWIFFFKRFLITSELQTERVTEDEWIHTICSMCLTVLMHHVIKIMQAWLLFLVIKRGMTDQSDVAKASAVRWATPLAKEGEIWEICGIGWHSKRHHLHCKSSLQVRIGMEEHNEGYFGFGFFLI